MFRVVLAMVLLFGVAALPVSAQDLEKAPPLLMLKQLTPTHPERVILTFNHMAGIQPDFSAWARISPFLKNAKRVDHVSIIGREENRLQRLWVESDFTTPIIVQTRIQLDEYSTLQETLTLSEFTPKTFFSYNIYGQNVAIVPNDIATFGAIQIDKTQMEEMLQKTGGGQAVAELILKPVVADAKTPFVQAGIQYWLLLAEIGEIRFWNMSNDNPQLLWMHRADWYKPEQDESLLKLKGVQ